MGRGKRFPYLAVLWPVELSLLKDRLNEILRNCLLNTNNLFDTQSLFDDRQLSLHDCTYLFCPWECVELREEQWPRWLVHWVELSANKGTLHLWWNWNVFFRWETLWNGFLFFTGNCLEKIEYLQRPVSSFFGLENRWTIFLVFHILLMFIDEIRNHSGREMKYNCHQFPHKWNTFKHF